MEKAGKMMLGDRIAVTTQGIMERMGVRENEIDSPAVIENYRKIELLGGSVKEVRKRLNKEVQSSSATLELSKALADGFKTASLSNQDDVCIRMYQKVTEFQDIMNDMHPGLRSILVNEVLSPLEQFEKSEIKDCMAAKKKYDKVRINYETSVAQLRSVGKKQKINLNKVLEAEVKKDMFEDAFRHISEETTHVMESAIEKHDFVVLDALCFYLNAYQSFFCNGVEYLKDIKAEVSQSKLLVEERRKQFEEKQKREALERQKQYEQSGKNGRILFGKDLVTLGKERGFEYPVEIGRAIDYLGENGTHAEGIFRVSPSKTQLDSVIENIEKGETIEWGKYPPHIAACVIKEFLRDMPNPLLTEELYKEWLTIEENTASEDEEDAQIKLLIEKLPKPHRSLLIKLMTLCVKIIANTEKNKMGAKQLGIVLAPNILHSEATTDPTSIVVALGRCNQVVFKLISYFDAGKCQLEAGEGKSPPRETSESSEKSFSLIDSPSTGSKKERLPLTALKPPSKQKPKTMSSPDIQRPKHVIVSPQNAQILHDEMDLGGSRDRTTAEFKITTEETVEVSIEEPVEVLSVEELALKRKMSLANIQPPNTTPPSRSPLSGSEFRRNSGWIRGVLKKDENDT